ncbi:MAG TPA: hypothetical protein DIT58_16775, partial [Porticoccaceae bacterium]|nr:hypothetical protein [Porticoccaceae bacterium]
LPLSELTQRLAPTAQTSSHGFGPTEVLSLAKALGRTLPEGYFVGIEGEEFQASNAFSTALQQAFLRYVNTIQQM